MDFNQTFDFNSLLSLSEIALNKLKGTHVLINKTDETIINGTITGFGLATNAPHLICSFQINNCIYVNFQSIKSMKFIEFD